MSNSKKKKNNIFIAYFKSFGVKQACDILMLVSAVLILIGAFVNETLLLVALIIFMVADAVMLVKNAMVLFNKNTHRRSPEYRSALTDTIITSIMFLMALFGLIYFFVR